MSNPSWIGKSIGNRYQIEEVLGSGGMSTVFKATDPNLKRVVAVKIIHPHMSMDADFVRRFEEEAASVGQLRHPNIVQVHDFNHDGDAYYMVLEFVPGESLAERLTRLGSDGRKMGNPEVIRYAGQICEAVDYAHQRGLIHRDLKPANVMLDVHGNAILMDFGIAKIVGGTRHTATGAVIGTAMYMSPEQIKGVEIDRRSDIYSLGVMLFEMVSGRPPFQADSAMTLMMMHVNDPVPDLRQLRPDLPMGLVQVIEKALAKDPNRRYQTAGEMAAALGNALETRVSQDMRDPFPVPTVIDQAAGGTVKVDPQPPAVTDSGTVIVQGTASGAYESAADDWDSLDDAYAPNQPTKKKLPKALIVGGIAGAIVMVCAVVAGLIFIPRLFDDSGDATPTVAVAEFEPTATQDELGDTGGNAAVDVGGETLPENTPTATLEPTEIPTATREPTATSEPTLTPYPTNYYVDITGISSDGTYYVVEYETFGFTEQLPGTHIHFFFNTVPPEQAGSPGSGPWILYGGPRPFKQYSLSARPASATMMCARVANPDHSLYDLASGNCFPLP